ncbi:MAG: hypothetical protein RL885_24630 [Planctomycetota bacterium]
MTPDKAAFIRDLVRRGIAGAGPIQKALKESFGSGVAPAELGPFIRGMGRGSGRVLRGDASAEASPAPRKRRERVHSKPRTRAPRFLVTWDWEGERHTEEATSAAEAERLVQAALDQGLSPADVAVFEKVSVRIQTRVRV